MSTKHTQGPWTVGAGSNKREILSCGTGAGRVAHCLDEFDDNPCGPKYGTGEVNANARLIAAAPDLLDACDEADTAFAVLNINSDEPLNPQARRALRDAWAKVNAAMAKATGKIDRFKEANGGK